MPSKRAKQRAEKELKQQLQEPEEEISYYNFPARLIKWLEIPGNFQKFQTVLMFQSVALALFYQWFQSQNLAF